MSNIKVKAVDQNIAFTDSPKIYSGDVNTDYVHFCFDEVWDGFIKTAVFYREVDKPYFQVLADDECIVPKEVMAKPGKFFMGVVGVLDDKVITSEVIGYDIGQGIMTPVEMPPTEDVWQQILAELNSIRVLANQIKQDQEEFQQQITQDNNQFKQNMAQSFNEYKTNTNESIKETLEKYGDMVVMMDIGEYIDPADRKTGSLYFNATERIDKVNDLIKVSPNMGIKIKN